MLHLTEISTPLQSVIDSTMLYDPLVASDFGYCVKTWMADKTEVACRPWRAVVTGNAVRITGWRDTPAHNHEKSVYLGTQTFLLKTGETLALSGQFIPLIRTKHRARDAAKGRENADEAYTAWLRERLVDIMPFAHIEQTRIDKHTQRRVLRKISHARENTQIASELIPVVDATIVLTVRNPEKIENWIKLGLGPQKAFGYGAFLPTLNPGELDSV
jgi:hypothetical protein